MLLSEMNREFEPENTFNGGIGEDSFEGGRGDQLIFGDGPIDDGAGDGTITITVQNMSEVGGTFQTPVWFGFHDGSFDLFDIGGTASAGLERLAEDGTTADIGAEFRDATDELGFGGVISNFTTNDAGEEIRVPFAPTDEASITLTLDDPTTQGFFSWATMVIPSNDAFLASPDDPLAARIFGDDGTFLGPFEILVSGDDVLDAGTEANLEQDAAFLNQTDPNTGIEGNGTVAHHLGFNGSQGNPTAENVNILAGGLPGGTNATNAAGVDIDPAIADFTIDPEAPIFRISIDQAPVVEEGDDDELSGGLGDDVIFGGGGNDTLRGNRGDDLIFGGSGEDIIIGGRGDDELHGNDGDDELNGNRGDDLMFGDAGNDNLVGNRGDDQIYGGDGDDDLSGNRGDDTLYGGAGDDELTGGLGGDNFVFSVGTGSDTITDFGSAGQDRIDVADFGFATAQELIDSAEDLGDGSTLISLNDDGDEITLIDVLVSELEQEHFIIEAQVDDDVDDEDDDDVIDDVEGDVGDDVVGEVGGNVGDDVSGDVGDNVSGDVGDDVEDDVEIPLVGALAGELGQENFII